MLKPIRSMDEELEMIFADLPVGSIIAAAAKLLAANCNSAMCTPEQEQEAAIRIQAANSTAPDGSGDSAIEQIALACLTRAGMAMFGISDE